MTRSLSAVLLAVLLVGCSAPQREPDLSDLPRYRPGTLLAGGINLGTIRGQTIRVLDSIGITTNGAVDEQTTSLAGLSYTGNALEFVRVNAGETGFELAAVTEADTLATVLAREAVTGGTNLTLSSGDEIRFTGSGGYTFALMAGLSPAGDVGSLKLRDFDDTAWRDFEVGRLYPQVLHGNVNPDTGVGQDLTIAGAAPAAAQNAGHIIIQGGNSASGTDGRVMIKDATGTTTFLDVLNTGAFTFDVSTWIEFGPGGPGLYGAEGTLEFFDGVTSVARFSDAGVDLRGTMPLFGHLTVYEAHSAGDALLQVESGSYHSNAGAGGAIELDLPTVSVAGVTYYVVAIADHDITVDPGAAEKFVPAVSGLGGFADGEAVVIDTQYEAAVFVSQADGDWVLLDVVGTLVEETP